LTGITTNSLGGFTDRVLKSYHQLKSYIHYLYML